MRLRHLIFSGICVGLVLFGFSGAVNADPDLLDDQPTTLVYPPFWHTPLGIHRGTPELLALFVGSRTRFDHPQALACNTLLSAIGSRNADPEFCLTVVGANTGQSHLLYNPTLSRLEVMGDTRNALGLFLQPEGLAMTADGTVFVADPGKNQVLRLELAAGRLAAKGILGPPPNGWLQPWGVTTDSQKRIYVTDRSANLIHCYSPDGQWQASLGPDLGPGIRLQHPTAIAVADPLETWSYYHDHYLFIVDTDGQRLLRTDGNGQFQCIAIPGAGWAASNSRSAFAWVALDYYENVWVTDPGRSQVHKFDRHLRYLDSFGEWGNGDRRFCYPTGIAIFRHFGQVFIAEEQGAHYFWIGADVRNVRAQWERFQPGGLCIDFFLTEPASVTVALANRKEPLYLNPWMDSGPHQIHVRVGTPSPDASLSLTAEATYSSAKYFAKRVRVMVEKP